MGPGLDSGNISLSNGDTTAIVVFSQPQSDVQYSEFWTLQNTVDAEPSIYFGIVIEKTVNGFSVLLSGPIDSDNYTLSWGVM